MANKNKPIINKQFQMLYIENKTKILQPAPAQFNSINFIALWAEFKGTYIIVATLL